MAGKIRTAKARFDFSVCFQNHQAQPSCLNAKAEQSTAFQKLGTHLAQAQKRTKWANPKTEKAQKINPKILRKNDEQQIKKLWNGRRVRWGCR